MRPIENMTSETLTEDERSAAARYAEAGHDRFKRLKGTLKGQTVVVAGNGPSLQDIDVDWLNSHVLFSQNYAHLDTRPIVPKYWVIGDLGVCLQDEQVEHWWPAMKRYETVTKMWPSPGMDAFHDDETVHRYWRRSLGRKFSWRGRVDPSDSEHQFGGIRFSTVSQASAMIAAWMGATTIVFVGLDGKHPERPDVEHFYPLNATRMRILALVKRGKVTMAKALNEPWRAGGYAEIMEKMTSDWDEGFRLLQPNLPGVKLLNGSTRTTYRSLRRVDWRDF